MSTFKLLAGRECNCSGMGRFSSADCSYALRKHLPVKGPWCVDDMDSEAYISQFSTDGSLLVGGFRFFFFFAMQEIHEGLDFSDDDDEFSFGIFSVKFSKDGRELVVGNNNESICIYDLGANKITERIHAHVADVNVVTFADETSDVLYSGSDDGLCKVWDRRCHRRQKPVGVLTGHLDGITFIDSRGDGHYFISNCKDQTIKLWDLRKMSSGAKDCTPKAYEWDYRWMTYPSEARYLKHLTGQRYIYTGSSDQCVYIYDVATGKVVEKLKWHGSIIRDCSWHPYVPTLVSSSWDGYLVRWEATEADKDPSMLKTGKQRMHPEGYTLSFVL
ncbi:hypothetical protein PR202_ga22825 [Eleusine coracana subsp. coracana]|uniref:LEC14B homolog n=1 Tax=Eleusine coracana subsp. coracana TaxID=191504 RepID=A0AAV5D568_ELECO|nr:hypothetical protein PR202_ga22825 [Eleusine coracana subsp. coracana]